MAARKAGFLDLNLEQVLDDLLGMNPGIFDKPLVGLHAAANDAGQV